MVQEQNGDIDPVETREWLDALQAVLSVDGNERASYLLQELLNKANAEGISLILRNS